MNTVIELKPEEQLDTETISEYIRETKSQTKIQKAQKSHSRFYAADILQSANAEVLSVARAIKEAVVPKTETSTKSSKAAEEQIKTDVLETLWPGVQQDFLHTQPVKKTPSYYWMLGFMGGALIALVIALSFSAVSSVVSHFQKSILGFATHKGSSGDFSSGLGNNGVRKPLVSNYVVKEGDTLAGVALQNYKHVSPRLLDHICKANNISDANLLVSGQKLSLPEYRY